MSRRFDDTYQAVGVGAAPGVSIGEVFVLDRARLSVPHRLLDDEEIPAEVTRFEAALTLARGQLETLLDKVVAKSLGAEHTYILEAHLLMLDDPELRAGVTRRVEREGINAEWALKGFMDSLKERFSRIDNEYLLERANDIDQIGERVLRCLLGGYEDPIRKVPRGAILVAHDLSPADTAELGRGRIAGFVTEIGGRTSHVAILARSMGLPAVVGLSGILDLASSGEIAILDGVEGKLILRPGREILESYRLTRQRINQTTTRLQRNRSKLAVTKDKTVISLQANLELLEEMDLLSAWGAEGVGMYRTEYLFMGHQGSPSEEQQFEVYRALVKECGQRSVTIRTFDLGGDKVQTEADIGASNPALGFRAVRYSLHRPELFKRQIRACLRAAAAGPLRIMVPMISTLEEVQAVKVIIEECRAQLREEGVPIGDKVPFGIMVETPAVAIMADVFAKEVDFFSIGTNDLIQYTLAVDRLSDELSYLYQPLHPAILRLIKQVVDAGARFDVDVSLCGEMAGEPLMAYVLLGLGLRKLSMSPVMIPSVKEMICSNSTAEAETFVTSLLAQGLPGHDARDSVRDHLAQLLPDPPLKRVSPPSNGH